MNAQESKKRIFFLKAELKKHADLYYVHDAPLISDEAYDSLYQELVSLEQAFPDLQEVGSPTQSVGSVVLESFQKVHHRYPQWSFDNVFDYSDLLAWDKKLKNILSKNNIFDEKLLYVCELKIDGLKVILDYEDGLLVRAATRGDGKIGEDVTEHVRQISDVPQKLKKKDTLSVVGEVWLEESKFEKINKKRALDKLDLYANARNLAAGTLRQLDTSIVAERGLRMFCYDLNSEELLFDSHQEELDYLKKNNFSVNPHCFISDSLQLLQENYDKWVLSRREQEYGVDGMVFKLDNKKYCSILGYTAKAPRFGFAYKFPAEQKTTKVLDIILQTGRTGVLTPVAILDPVLIDGSMVSRASLHNQDEIQRLGLMLGDTVVVEKAGDIIPKIKSVLDGLRDGSEKIFSFESYLENLGIEYFTKKSDAGVLSWYAKNDPALLVQSLSYFASKKAMNIDGLGEKNVQALVAAGFVNTISDFYKLKKENLLSLALFKDKASHNLLESIEKSRDCEYKNFIVSLGIPHVGSEISELISLLVSDPKKFLDLAYEDLISLDGVGDKIAESVVIWIANGANRELYLEMISFLRFAEVSEKSRSDLEGKIFVITGSFEKYSRNEISDIIKSRSGKVSSQVSSKTSFLIVGEKAGSKLKKAQDLNIECIYEKDLDEFLR